MDYINVKTIENDEKYLRQISKEVKFDDKNLKEDIKKLIDFSKKNEVLAMAAVQLGIPKRIIYVKNTNLKKIESDQKENSIVDIDYDEEILMINPVIKNKKGLTKYWEACVSCLDLMGLVKRPYYIEIEYYDIEGKKHSISYEGFPSTVICHEYDHLDGILHIDIAEKVLDMEADERRLHRQKEGYEILNKTKDFESIK